ncbi:MAG: TonB family protein [Thermodesulfovibrionales bacterium]
MKKVRKALILSTLVFVLLSAAHALAGQPESDDRTLSPYFFVKSEDSAVDRLPLKSTYAAVNIAGVIADVRVTQVYKNEGKTPLEAIYVFPGSTRAAVYAMKMTIGERVINAKINTKEQARKDYENAKNQGKSASLLEQHRPNVFQMNVANIMPGDEIKVELSYTELLVPTDKIYEFIYPTVVGPRYSNQQAATAPASESWVENPYLRQGQSPTHSFDITINVSAGMPIQDITCSSHKVDIEYDGATKADVRLVAADKKRGNKDFILKYRLAGKRIGSGLLLYEGDDENFFLMMLQPPKRVKVSQIPPREYIFIMDVSGSMHGFPLDISKKLLKDLIGNLRPTDTFNVLLFAGRSTIMSKMSLPATPQNIKKAIYTIDSQQGGGGTELLSALKRALALPGIEDISRSVVIVTDGYVHVEKEAFDLIRNNLGEANMFAFGIGSSVNRHIIEGMAHVGMGEPFVITKPEDAAATADKFRKLIQTPVLTSIEIDYDTFDVYDVEPLSIPDVLAERPVIVFGKWRGKPRGTIVLSGLTGNGTYATSIEVDEIKPSDDNTALRYLWARHRIAILDDYNRLSPEDERIKEVTNLGLKYNLLTQYTSFVAIDDRIRNVDGKIETVKQPLPLPEGVSNYAVGSWNRPASAPVKSGALRGLMAQDKVSAFEEEVAREPKVKENKKREVAGGKAGEIEGDMPESEVQRVLDRHMKELNECYKKALKKSTGLKGMIVLKLVIDQKGRVESVKVVKNSLMSKSFKKCILKIVNNMKFKSPAGGSKVTATITLNFS